MFAGSVASGMSIGLGPYVVGPRLNIMRSKHRIAITTVFIRRKAKTTLATIARKTKCMVGAIASAITATTNMIGGTIALFTFSISVCGALAIRQFCISLQNLITAVGIQLLPDQLVVLYLSF